MLTDRKITTKFEGKMNNPRQGKGERNLWCQSYSQCLDIAIEGSWDSFHCEGCSSFGCNETTIKHPVFNKPEASNDQSNSLNHISDKQNEYKNAVKNNLDRVGIKIFLFVKINGKVQYRRFRSGFKIDHEEAQTLTERLVFIKRDKIKLIKSMYDLLKEIQGLFKIRM